MVDVETLGNKSNSIILSIAAVPFNMLGQGLIYAKRAEEQFYENISISSCQKAGLKMDESTLLWWLKQDKDAIKYAFLIGVDKKVLNLSEVLFKLSEFIQNLSPKELLIWGNSARFDLGILENAYIASGKKKIPWKYSKERDVRTLVNFNPNLKRNLKFTGIKHHPIDDCIHQIKYCTKIYKTLSGMNRKGELVIV